MCELIANNNKIGNFYRHFHFWGTINVIIYTYYIRMVKIIIIIIIDKCGAQII